MRRAFITGITGQDGSYLAELLVNKGYEVHGLVYKSISHDIVQKNPLPKGVVLHEGDLKECASLIRALEETVPDEVYNLAGVSDLQTARKFPHETMEVNYYGVGRLVNVSLRVNPQVRIFQAGSALMFDHTVSQQNELTSFLSEEPYSEAKIRAHKDFVLSYREKKGAFICTGFLFNHESPRRDLRFVTQKIVQTLINNQHGEGEILEIGNLDAKRDWGFAGDYVEAMWLMLQQDKPDDYVIATGVTHSVRDFIETVVKVFGKSIVWEGTGLKEIGKDEKGNVIVKVNEKYYQPLESRVYCGDITKIQRILGWKPRVNFEELIRLMTEGKT
ncbi:MAG TPA: GDP-mannose 4,6-dehydratase [Candidatus Paceibacterota bacterium]